MAALGVARRQLSRLKFNGDARVAGELARGNLIRKETGNLSNQRWALVGELEEGAPWCACSRSVS